MDSILLWITHYGYVAIFTLLVLGIVGLPVPDEWLLTFVGYLVFQGKLSLLPAAGSALGGSVCGITLSYLLGRTVGLHFLIKYGQRFHLTQDKLDTTHRWFRRIGRWTLPIGYFVPGVRHLTAYVAGASKLEFPFFTVFAYGGAVVWCATFIGLGYFTGERWESVTHYAHRVGVAGAAAVGGLGLIYYLWRRRKPRQPEPL